MLIFPSIGEIVWVQTAPYEDSPWREVLVTHFLATQFGWVEGSTGETGISRVKDDWRTECPS